MRNEPLPCRISSFRSSKLFQSFAAAGCVSLATRVATHTATTPADAARLHLGEWSLRTVGFMGICLSSSSSCVSRLSRTVGSRLTLS